VQVYPDTDTSVMLRKALVDQATQDKGINGVAVKARHAIKAKLQQAQKRRQEAAEQVHT
jgi:hypothetical protein